MKRILILFLLSLSILSIYPKTVKYNIKGSVINKYTRRPIEFANVIIEDAPFGAATDTTGKFIIRNVTPGIVRFNVSCIGYKSITTPEYIISSNTPFLIFELEEDSKMLQGIVVTPNMPTITFESPVSLKIIGLKDIEKIAGANRDVSRIVRSYPGVAFSPIGYRNDLIVRGGGPSENRYFMDGIEIPNINHFATQGASGGPVSLINADLIREINFYTGAFPANRGGALSSVMDFRLRDGNKEENRFKGTLGASEVAFSGNGPINDNTTYFFSARQSYLQFLFKLLGLPFLPTYLDGQAKIKHTYKEKNEFTFLALGGAGWTKLNLDQKGEEEEYMLGYLPKISQYTYTIGGSYKHYADHHTQGVYLSHSYLYNKSTKYRDNDESSEENLTYRLRSFEQKSSLRAENKLQLSDWNIREGFDIHYARYSNRTKQSRYTDEINMIDYNSKINLWSWGLFFMSNYTSDDNKISASAGIRTDATIYGNLKNPFKQLSPRFSVRYNLNEKISIGASLGVYYQLPPYTSLGFRDSSGILVNRQLKYMRVFQTSIGTDWRIKKGITLSGEIFYKRYSNIPLSLTDNIPLTCKGNDFGIIGDEALSSTALGRAYGIEFMGKWENEKKLSLTGSLTIYKSEFKNNENSPYIDSSWDNKFILNVSAYKDFRREWSVGAKLSYIGGAPYTPYDLEKSSLVEAWDARLRPYYNFDLYNTENYNNYAQLDVRVDKSYYFKNWMIGFYIDIQNILGSKLKRPSAITSTGVIENPTAPPDQQRYVMKYIKQESGSIIPTISATIEF